MSHRHGKSIKERENGINEKYLELFSLQMYVKDLVNHEMGVDIKTSCCSSYLLWGKVIE